MAWISAVNEAGAGRVALEMATPGDAGPSDLDQRRFSQLVVDHRDPVMFVDGDVFSPAVEERLARVGLENQAAERVDVGGNGERHISRAPDFRRSVVCGAAPRPQVASGEAEVDEHRLRRLTGASDGFGVTHDDVGRLHVEMSDSDGVHGVEASAHAQKQIACARE